MISLKAIALHFFSVLPVAVAFFVNVFTVAINAPAAFRPFTYTQKLVTMIVDTFGDIGNYIGKIYGRLADLIEPFFGRLVPAIKESLFGVWQIFSVGFLSIGNFVIGLIQGMDETYIGKNFINPVYLFLITMLILIVIIYFTERKCSQPRAR